MAGVGHLGSRGTLGLWAGRAGALLRDRSEAGRSRLFAAGAFTARVANAGLGFLTQIGLARWMGERDYGIYASVWVWVLVGGGLLSLGLPVAALKLVPEYRERRDAAGLRGFLSGSRRLGMVPSVGLAAAALILTLWAGPALGPYLGAVAVALVILPIYVLTDIQTGIARAFDYAGLGLLADYVLRPSLLLAVAAALWLGGAQGTATTVMAATLAAVALTALGQGTALQRRTRREIGDGPARRDLPRWIAVSWPLLAVTTFTLLLGAVDVLILQLFVGPEEVAVYFAATKIVAVASFVSYGVANTSAHRFAAQVARGDRAGMSRFAAETVRWTFWPTLAVAIVLSAAAPLLLRLFGASFGAGTDIVWILSAGLVAGAAVGPADRALAMADHGRATVSIYAASVAATAALCVVLVPLFGLAGAAAATALATVLRALLLFRAARLHLGLHMSILPAVQPAERGA